MEFLGALLGALVGGAAAIFGTYAASSLQRRADAQERREQRMVASRAFRDDFWVMQSCLADAVRTGDPLEVGGIEAGQLGSRRLLLGPAGGLYGEKEWSDVAGARRAYITILQVASRGDRPSEDDLHKWYWRFQRTREALALLDPTWPAAGLHPDHGVMGERPHDFHEIDYHAFRKKAGNPSPGKGDSSGPEGS